MRAHVPTTMIIAILLIALPSAALAQSAQGGTTTTTTTTNQQPATAPAADTGDEANHAIASGFLGSNFGNNADPASLAFGGSVGYLWKNKFGAEFDVGFTPDFELENNFFGLGSTPRVGSYMANAIFAMPLGIEGKWQPFVSGGAGALTLRSSLDDGFGAAIDGLSSSTDTRFGGNVGGGLMGFAGKWGFRADVRYFRATGTYDQTLTATDSASPAATTGGIVYDSAGNIVSIDTSSTVTAASSDADVPTTLAEAALTGLHFWRANVGVALRW